MKNGRCRMHGGTSLAGADSPTFKHGFYSRYASAEIGEKIEAYLDADPLDLTQELALTRALLADFLSGFSDGRPDAEALGVMSALVDRIRKTIDTIAKIKNENALTAAEVTFLAVRFVQLINEMTDDPTKREAIKSQLFAIIPAESQQLIE